MSAPAARGRNAAMVVLQEKTNAASATWLNINVGKVRNAVIGTERSEGLLSALSSQISKRPTATICVSRSNGLVRAHCDN
ncbi:hypothetical protein GS634_00605 [Ruegeria atlantica]|uniref:Uncharacterized protein n=1 Tax=Ruegeria atlantica TaxID=81569 RepID=A0AA91BS22_9RHOB|nr:hypothetical protein [Ruegeria atlantica]NOE16618.1 hypothetical protein [Ruegeria atlantica]